MEQTEAERDAAAAFVRTFKAIADAGAAIASWGKALANIAPTVSQVAALMNAWRAMEQEIKPHRWAYRRKSLRFAGHRRWPGKRQRR